MFLYMQRNSVEAIEEFLNDVGFPVSKKALVQEADEFHLSSTDREAIALLPDREYLSKGDVHRELTGITHDEPVALEDIDDPFIDDADTEPV
ncbi:MAG: hypothetical protein RIQ41_446 [Candidatus Parcubacteria bacterium]|jgi:hypothetical protein